MSYPFSFYVTAKKNARNIGGLRAKILKGQLTY